MKFIGYRTIKTSIGVILAIALAKELGLKYAVSAGVIVILSIQSTKRKSMKLAIQRIEACVLALAISSVLFNLIGFNDVVFGMFLLAFIPIAAKLGLAEGIVVSSVLVSHLLGEKTANLSLIINELGLMGLGVGVALVMNIYIPSVEGKIKKDQVYIEERMKGILKSMAMALKENTLLCCEEELFNNLEERLKDGRRRAYKNLNNYLFTDVNYYAEYMEMRTHQFDTLKRMKEHFLRFYITYDQTKMMADFTEEVGDSFNENNSCEYLLNKLNTLHESFKAMALPETREEFENRAVLFQFLRDMEEFLIVKNEFSMGNSA